MVFGLCLSRRLYILAHFIQGFWSLIEPSIAVFQYLFRCKVVALIAKFHSIEGTTSTPGQQIAR